MEQRLSTRVATAARAAAVAQALLFEASEVSDTDTVFDRYIESARMYWSVTGIKPVPEDVLALLPQNDLVILFDVPPSVAMRRRDGTAFTSAGDELAYLTKCASYLKQTAESNDWEVVRTDRPLDRTINLLSVLLGELGLRPRR